MNKLITLLTAATLTVSLTACFEDSNKSNEENMASAPQATMEKPADESTTPNAAAGEPSTMPMPSTTPNMPDNHSMHEQGNMPNQPAEQPTQPQTMPNNMPAQPQTMPNSQPDMQNSPAAPASSMPAPANPAMNNDQMNHDHMMNNEPSAAAPSNSNEKMPTETTAPATPSN